MLIRTLSAAGAFAALAVTASVDASGPRYRLVILETIDDAPLVSARAINESGQVAGMTGFTTVDPGQHATVWNQTVPTNLDPMFDISSGEVISESGVVAGIGSFCPPLNGPCSATIARALPGGAFVSVGTLGGNAMQVVAINATGDFVGWAYNDDSLSRGFLHTEAIGLRELGTLGGFASRANDVNDSTQVVGAAYNAVPQERAFMWEDGVMTDLGTLGGNRSSAAAINNDGVIVGWSRVADGSVHAFLMAAGGAMQDIHTLPQATSSRATILSETGIVGGTWSDGKQDRIFRWTEAEGMIDLGVPAGVNDSLAFIAPIDINADGTMIGFGHTELYASFAWVHSSETGMVEVTELIASEPAFQIGSVAGINDAGQIAVSGHHFDSFWQQRGGILEPVAPCDLTADGAVDVDDLVELLLAWGPCAGDPCIADLDGDGTVGVDDLVALITAWS